MGRLPQKHISPLITHNARPLNPILGCEMRAPKGPGVQVGEGGLAGNIRREGRRPGAVSLVEAWRRVPMQVHSVHLNTLICVPEMPWRVWCSGTSSPFNDGSVWTCVAFWRASL